MVTWVWGDIHYPPLFPKHIASLSALMLGWADWSGTNTAICKISQWTEAWLSRVHPLWVNVKNNRFIIFLNFRFKEDVRSFKTLYQNHPKLQKQHSQRDYCMLMFFFFLKQGSPTAPEAKHYKITVSLRELKSYWTSTVAPFWKTQRNLFFFFFMQLTDKLQKITATRTSLELTLLSDTHIQYTVQQCSSHAFSRDKEIAFYRGHRPAQWEMRHNSFLFSHIHLHQNYVFYSLLQ